MPPLSGAEPPGILAHQGRVAVNGVNFDGTGRFKFSLVNGAGDTTLWSHDGSGAGGGEPAGSVAIAVTGGHYAVLLGDTAPPFSMAPIPAGVFAENADVRLRLWFSADGGTTFELLAPDRRLTPAPYALTAGTLSGAGGIQLSGGSLVLPATTASAGIVFSGADTLLHARGTDNFFAGILAGNLTMTGTGNTAGGAHALGANTEGEANTAGGAYAMASNTTGSRNYAGGFQALSSNLTGSENTATGYQALAASVSGARNTAYGYQALSGNLIGSENTAAGYQALAANADGSENTAAGYQALAANLGGMRNTAAGYQTLAGNTYGSENTGTGYQSLSANISGDRNSATGFQALAANTLGARNTAAGHQALSANTLGSDNLALGNGAGASLTTGNHNIAIAHPGVAGESATIRLGDAAHQTRAFIAGVRGQTTGLNDAVPVVIDSAGQLGTLSSSARYKEDIRSLDAAEVGTRLRKLRPVTFRYRQAFAGGEKPIQFGLIAEEVAEAFPELAVFDAEGRPETVKYQLLAPLLLGEVQRLEAENATLKARLERLETALFGEKASLPGNSAATD
ncbi:MAG: tail fiber domain-containing protein [Akkermansiaceae bacterium]|nr:tail fiber domain-containing protein [Akkermansiaceae bacterium]MCP5549452.1 tail fiber domain-containing protein [Akkermansiaceae bacterium]